MALPDDTGVDLTNSLNVPMRTVGSNTYGEILFAPTGGVMNATDLICLRVKDTNVQAVAPDTVIAVIARSGFIASHPISTGSDPFAYAKDCASSGL